MLSRRGSRVNGCIPCNARARRRGWALDDDLQLVQAVIRGEARAVREFVDRAGPVALGVFRNHFGLDRSTAEDLFQQVFVNLAANGYRKLRTFRGEAKLRTWFTAVCRNVAVDHLRANRHQAQPVEAMDDDDPADPIDNLPGDCDTQAGASAAELRARLSEALALLPDAYRVVLVLCYRDGLDYHEIAARTGDTINNVGVKLTRGRAKLRRIVESQFPDLPLHLDDE